MSTSPRSNASKPRSRMAAGLPAITSDQIVDTALTLTMEHGLENWTIRQLASAVQAFPSVIYYHVGDREVVVNAVLERVVGMVGVPPAQLPWRDWYRVLLGELRSVLHRYPGVARRLALDGPPASVGGLIIDRGIRLLQDAGFGQESALVFNMILNMACQFVATEDDRSHRQSGRRAAAYDYAEFRDNPELPGLAAMGSLMHDLAEHPESLAGFYAGFYDYAVERTLDGVAKRLADIRP
ncbi:TetR/AcrR family transcriptional regulator [Nocardia sp. NPDC058658]|uniref:TetR/AcrR family transcriptional regulator n=1 Tax=Nocardia sp. NPDC058658 TaxID=3346580 RepID=UPI00365CCBFD